MSLFETQLKQSASDFQAIVWPAMQGLIEGGMLVPVESVTSSGFAEHLDQLAGVDAWQIVDGRGIRPIASRVQWCEKNWRTWTVRRRRVNSRYATEFEKLIGNSNDGTFLRPAITIQAYLDSKGGHLLGAAAIRTQYLSQMLRDGFFDNDRRNPQDGTLFVPVHWDRAKRLGYPVFEAPGAPLPGPQESAGGPRTAARGLPLSGSNAWTT